MRNLFSIVSSLQTHHNVKLDFQKSEPTYRRQYRAVLYTEWLQQQTIGTCWTEYQYHI